MRYICDHDLHIHSQLSLCSGDDEQTPQRILAYARENRLNTLCLTDHFWDDGVEGASNWYQLQNFQHIAEAKPLPQAEGIDFLFGCESEMDKFFRIGISRACMEQFDFVIIPTTHLHMMDFTIAAKDNAYENRARLWVERLDALLNMDIPFGKIGLAHMTCSLMAPTREEYLQVVKLIPEDEMKRLFDKAAKLGLDIELNSSALHFGDEQEAEIALVPYKIAKARGCKFYCGSDAHPPDHLERTKAILESVIVRLELLEEDKFHIAR